MPSMSIATALRNDLLFHRMSAREELGRLSEFEIDLLSTRRDIKFSDMLATPVTVTLELVGGQRHFNGYVTRFAQAGMRGRYHLYRASARPWFWFLTRTADCRIFQKKNVPDIIKEVLDDHQAIAKVEYRLSRSYRTWEYCVQYRETDFNFLSRLMEQEGIYYYFSHESGKHTMIITDSYGGHRVYPGHDELQFIPHERVRPEAEGITEWTFAHEVQPGRYVIDDYNFTEPRVSRQVGHARERPHGHSNYEIYDHPGEYDIKSEGEAYVGLRLEELQSGFEVAHATSNSRGVAAGSLFTLRNYPRTDQNRQYLIVSASYDLVYSEYETMPGGGSDYSCSFTAMYGKNQPFRPQRITPKPVVQGPQTAVVVGPAGDEIHTDEYGRVKVQFHWDRYGQRDHKSSCYMRVAQVWAGNNWGATFIPRIGQEVVVSFLEGDPDNPIIIGSVYNAIQRPPYLGQGRDGKHKNDPHVSGIKTNSTKGGTGFNELRFDDTKDKEQVFIHAQRNYDVRVKNEMMQRITANRHTIVGAEKEGARSGDDRTLVHQDRHREVKRDEVIKIGGNRQELVQGDYDNIIKGTHKEQVNSDRHLQIAGKKAEKVGGSVSLSVGQNLQEKVGMNAALEAGMEIHLKAGMKVVIEAGAQISLKGPGGFVDIGPAGVTIQGVMVLINSGGAAGAGSGCSPESPQAPEEAKPIEPSQADNSTSGSKSCS